MFGPLFQISSGKTGRLAQIVGDFLVNILQGGGQTDTMIDSKAEAIGLSWTMIGILAKDHDFNLIKGREIKGMKDKLGRRVDGRLLVFRFHELSQLGKVVLLKFFRQYFFPAGFDSNLHSLVGFHVSFVVVQGDGHGL